MKIQIRCPVCNVEYNINPKRLKYGRGTTCSRSCSYILRSNKAKKTKQSCYCYVCKKEIYRLASAINSRNFCSNKCKSIGYSKIYSIGHRCNDFSVLDDKIEFFKGKCCQLTKCKCGRIQLTPTYRLNIKNKQAVTKCIDCHIQKTKQSRTKHKKTQICSCPSKQWKIENPEKAKEHNRRYNEKIKEKIKIQIKNNRDKVDSIKKQYGCTNPNCKWNGEFESVMLEFHHLDKSTKKGNIGMSLRWTTKRIIDEINKCCVLCANCHRQQTYKFLDTNKCKQCRINYNWSVI